MLLRRTLRGIAYSSIAASVPYHRRIKLWRNHFLEVHFEPSGKLISCREAGILWSVSLFSYLVASLKPWNVPAFESSHTQELRHLAAHLEKSAELVLNSPFLNVKYFVQVRLGACADKTRFLGFRIEHKFIFGLILAKYFPEMPQQLVNEAQLLTVASLNLFYNALFSLKPVGL